MIQLRTKTEFMALVGFMVCAVLVLTNGFSGRIFAESDDENIYTQIEPIGEVLAEILDNYVYTPDMDKAVEGALMGIMSSLDRNSSYIPPASYQSMREDTEGSFEGIGVQIRFDEESQSVWVYHAIPGAPAMKSGIRSKDYIVAVDGVETSADYDEEFPMKTLEQITKRIKGPRGTSVDITVSREPKTGGERERHTFTVRRGRIPLNSISEARLLDNGIGYLRITDFKKNTADDVEKHVKEMAEDHLSALIIDLRWNPGGLLSSSKELCELFLPKGSLVTFTRGREQADGRYLDDMKLYTQKHPIIPESVPIIVLVGSSSASSSEIVTGAMQFYKRALIVGEKTYGKGSVQTVIGLTNPQGSALRLTTALYYTPADVTIDQVGILPDVVVEMTIDEQRSLREQMALSMQADESLMNLQNHGLATGNTEGEEENELVNDVVLNRAIELLREKPNFDSLIEEYHRDVSETQKMASQELRDQKVH